MAKQSTALALWDKDMAAAAQSAVDEVAGLGGGSFFSLRGGKLALGDTKMLDNTVVGVVVESVYENVFYGTDFDPENPASPVCYAFGKKPDEMKPHEAVEKPVYADCKSCANNQFGSAEKGRGKACKNRVRLALICGGDMRSGHFEPYDADGLKAQQLAFLNVPPTSIGAWGSYVKALAAAQKRPPYGCYTKVKLVPDDRVQMRLEFEFVGKVEKDVADVVLSKRTEGQAGIVFPYPKRDEQLKKTNKKRRF